MLLCARKYLPIFMVWLIIVLYVVGFVVLLLLLLCLRYQLLIHKSDISKLGKYVHLCIIFFAKSRSTLNPGARNLRAGLPPYKSKTLLFDYCYFYIECGRRWMLDDSPKELGYSLLHALSETDDHEDFWLKKIGSDSDLVQVCWSLLKEDLSSKYTLTGAVIAIITITIVIAIAMSS